MSNKVASVGRYNGVFWVRRRIADVFPHLEPSQIRAYFIRDDLMGSHFPTQRELFAWVDKNPDQPWDRIERILDPNRKDR